MLTIEHSALLVIDVQQKLLPVIDNHSALLKQSQIMLKAARALALPVLVSEQLPDKLGATDSSLMQLLDSPSVITKDTFSAWQAPLFQQAVTGLKRKQLILIGIEAHICVYQTAIDLIQAGFEVHVLQDAVSSRTPDNKQLGLMRMQQAGAQVSSTEMALFELMKVAKGDAFKQVVQWIK